MKDDNIIAVLESIKPYEKRIPIHPKHFPLIKLKKNKLVFQNKYAINFDQDDISLRNSGFDLATRDNLIETADIIFLLKPIADDLRRMKQGATLIGWCHAVQQVEIARIAKERKLTLIAMEAMYKEVPGKRKTHVFHDNNFIAGYLGIEHALSVVPIKYTRDAKVVVISYGTVSQASVLKLVERGFRNVTVFSKRRHINDTIDGVSYKTLIVKDRKLFLESGQSLKNILLKSDIIVNGIMQDVLNPYEFLSLTDLKSVKNKLIIDISCDEKMGFDFAQATNIHNPLIKIGENFYYGVDNIPALCWEKISLTISKQLVPILNAYLLDIFDQEKKILIAHATEIKAGEIINKTITKYQSKLG